MFTIAQSTEPAKGRSPAAGVLVSGLLLLVGMLLSLQPVGARPLGDIDTRQAADSQDTLPATPSAKIAGKPLGTASATTSTPSATPSATPACQSRWIAISSPNPPQYNYSNLYGIAAVSVNDVWAVGDSRGTLAMHWDGSQWSIVPSPNSDSVENHLRGVAAVSANDVWAVGYHGTSTDFRTLIEHWDGSQWTIVPSPNPTADENFLYGVAASAADDVWAVGRSHTLGDPSHVLVEHWDGSRWNVVPGPDPGPGIESRILYGVAALSATDAWAVGTQNGYQSLTMHWDGTQWIVVSSPDPSTNNLYLRGIAALSTGDVWAVGDHQPTYTTLTLIEHWDGTSWSIVSSPSPGDFENHLNGVAGVATDDVWAVGYQTTLNAATEELIEHWDGSQWSVVPAPASQGLIRPWLYGVAAVAGNDVWAVGVGGGSSANHTVVERYTDGFADVNHPDYFYEAVSYLYCAGDISGYSDGTFRPYNSTTRGQLSKIVVLAEAWPFATPTGTPTFQDVPADSPFYQYIETAYSHSIISGYGCGTGCLEFRPGNNVTRGQLSKIIVLAESWSLENPPNPTFRDVLQGDTFYRYVETAYSHSIISGYGCGTGCLEFRPGNNATRGQISKIVYNAVTQP